MAQNEFESGSRKMIPGVLVYAFHQEKILMLYRNKKGPTDYHHGKWNGLGGKLDPDESATEGALRETREESGIKSLDPRQLELLGHLHFPNFKPHRSEDWMVWVFAADLSQKQVQEIQFSGPEGELHWIDPTQLLELNLWAGDREFLPKVLSRQKFSGTLWYEGELLRRVEWAH